ncbi:hypothetical protein WMW72_34395 [Paenibacillus filicis]|uniref:Uncharacterized protein n=1 Tax=Paenibacillus filicis TaxID=669464 RepID=A0ABU9DVR2_9BACL
MNLALRRIKEQIDGMQATLYNRATEVDYIAQKVDLLMKPEHKLAEDYDNLVQILSRARELMAKTS